MAERRIVDGPPGRGVVSFISNYSWLDGLSHPLMRARFAAAFDAVWVDCLNGDKYKTGKLTPDGRPDPWMRDGCGDPVIARVLLEASEEGSPRRVMPRCGHP